MVWRASFQMYTMGAMLETLCLVKYRWGKEKLIAGRRAREVCGARAADMDGS